MEISEKSFDNPVDFLNFLSSWNNDLSGYVFRGHSSDKFELLPSVLRSENRHIADYPFGNKVSGKKNFSNHALMQIQSEFTLLRSFYKTADNHGLKVPTSDYLRKYLAGTADYTFITNLKKGDKWIPENLLEVTALAQHYGLPTRLLDWTYDPFVAAHFAFKGAIFHKGNPVVWCLNARKIADEVNFEPNFPIKIVTPPYFDNQNLSAQKGLFTHIETELSAELLKNNMKVDRRPLNVFASDLPSKSGLSGNDFMLKIIIPNKFALNAYELLEKHGYGEARIYPGYNGVVKQVMRSHRPSINLDNK